MKLIPAAWDIGLGDKAVITFVREGKVVATFQSNGIALKRLAGVALAVANGSHFMRKNDVDIRDLSSDETRAEILADLDIDVERTNGDPIEVAIEAGKMAP